MLADGQCHKPNIGFTFQLSCAITAPSSVANPGSCAPSATGFANTDPFSQVVDVCDAPAAGGGCASGSVCVPKAGGSYLGGVCISQQGAVACPSTWPTPIQAYTDAVDDRDCAACQCNVSGTTCSAGKYTMYDANSCNAGGTTDVTSASCVDLSDELDFASWSMKATLPQPSGGACAVGGGNPVGSVQTQGAVTICCQ